MNRQRITLLLFAFTVLFSASCGGTWTVVCLPSGGCVSQIRVDLPQVTISPSPTATSTAAPTLTPSVTVSAPTLTEEPTQTYTWLDSTPTYEVGAEPTITPTWSSCQVGNYNVIVTTPLLNVRLQTVSMQQDPYQQKIVGQVRENNVLEVDACLIEYTPGGWLPVQTITNLQGIVFSQYTKLQK